jgi:hypothetical protein
VTSRRVFPPGYDSRDEAEQRARWFAEEAKKRMDLADHDDPTTLALLAIDARLDEMNYWLAQIAER